MYAIYIHAVSWDRGGFDWLSACHVSVKLPYTSPREPRLPPPLAFPSSPPKRSHEIVQALKCDARLPDSTRVQRYYQVLSVGLGMTDGSCK